MIIVIVAAGIGVDWWDAKHGRPLPVPGEVVSADGEAMKRLTEEVERLRTDNALLNMQNDALRKQIEEFRQPTVDLPKTAAERNRADAGKVLGD